MGKSIITSISSARLRWAPVMVVLIVAALLVISEFGGAWKWGGILH